MHSENNHIRFFEFDENHFVSGVTNWGPYKIGYYLARARGKERENQDVVFVLGGKEKAYVGVSDGAGGHPKGAEAAFIVCDSIRKAFDENGEINSAIDLIFDSNKKVVDLKVGAKCTLCLCVLDNDSIQAFSVGDSEIVGWNHLGKEIYSNIPDSTVGYSVEAGYLTQEESLHDPERYAVNNMMGDRAIRAEVTSRIETKKGHTYIIGSDGLFDNHSHNELYNIVGEGSFEESFANLVSVCNNQDIDSLNKVDDISFVVLRKVRAKS